MPKVVTSLPNQQVRLEHSKFKLGFGIQPRYNGCFHGPGVNIKACKDDQIRFEPQCLFWRKYLDVCCFHLGLRQCGDLPYIREEVNKVHSIKGDALYSGH